MEWIKCEKLKKFDCCTGKVQNRQPNFLRNRFFDRFVCVSFRFNRLERVRQSISMKKNQKHNSDLNQSYECALAATLTHIQALVGYSN